MLSLALTESIYLKWRYFKLTEKYPKKVLLALDERTYDYLAAVAEEQERSLSAQVRFYIKEGMRNETAY